MQIHPGLESLIRSVNSDKNFNKENLTRWCSPLPKEEKAFLTLKIKEGVTREEFIKILSNMTQPGPKSEVVIQPTPVKSVPTIYKKGDVLMHPIFKHPYILLEKKSEFWLCGLITSEPTCTEILESCRSRFFADGFITRVIFTTVDPIGKFMYPYENARQLNLVTKKLKSMFL